MNTLKQTASAITISVATVAFAVLLTVQVGTSLVPPVL